MDLIKHKTPDKDELGAALANGWIKRQKIRKLMREVEAGGFSPTIVRNVEERLHL